MKSFLFNLDEREIWEFGSKGGRAPPHPSPHLPTLLKCRRIQDDIVEIVRGVFAVDGMSIVAYNCLHRRFVREP